MNEMGLLTLALWHNHSCNRDYRESTGQVFMKFYMAKVSGRGQSCMKSLLNRLYNLAVAGLNRLCVLKFSNVKFTGERAEDRFGEH